MVYEVDLERVWNLPYCINEWTDGRGAYCAVGKIAEACGQMELTLLNQTFYSELDEVIEKSELHMGPAMFGSLVHDASVNAATTPEDKLLAHQKVTRQLLEMCLKAGLIKIKDSDLDIVRELKQYEKEVVNV